MAWSSDSRLFVSGSKDSTLKVRTGRGHIREGLHGGRAWRSRRGMTHTGRAPEAPALRPEAPPPDKQVWEVRSRKLKVDLPGHADEVFTVDWSPDGSGVASGGKDRVLKLWRH